MVDARRSLRHLEQRDAFHARHIGTTADDRAEMLAGLGLDGMDQLIERTVPAAIRLGTPLALDGAVPEHEALERLHTMARRNRVVTSLIGAGYHGTHTPAVIQRNVLENPAWYTAYTPYQPEISQGRLEALLNFQTMVADLTGMELANASLLDEGTAAAEAITMARRLTRHRGTEVFVDAACHPQTVAVVATRAEPLGIGVVVGRPEEHLDPERCFAVLLQEPGTTGEVRSAAALRDIAERVHAAGGMVLVAADLLSLVLLEPPGRWGADVVVGSSQRFGVPMGFGGPHAAFIATREANARSLPGRLVGVSSDAAGRPALRLALQTREQHIRREKATSNICTAQVLLAVMAGLYAVYHGPEGLRTIAERVHRLTSLTAAALRRRGFDPEHGSWFDTLTVPVTSAAEVVARALDLGLNLRTVDAGRVGLSFDETSTPDVVLRALAAFGVHDVDLDALDDDPSLVDGIPGGRRRTGPLLTHPVFHRYHAEHDLLRYLRHLADLDLALDRTMIPLGSCTMKLNATTEMIPVTWPEFAALHPFAPADQTEGSLQVVRDLEGWLAEITGYDAVSLQPNAGSQGEFAGLMAIRAFHRANGAPERDVCLIPSSAHGTNAASAVMAGMRVVVVACDEQGNVDVDDLRAKAAQHADRLAALMVTYPSTHGVFEEAIAEVCAVVHDHGGQVYVDGANLNALVGTAKPGRFGADVSHLNLHKTFCIPHGGGGPGVGPVAVRAHLAPYLPNHPLRADAGPLTGPGPVSAAPFGSAGILTVSWVYVTMMGAHGLRQATEAAILAANHVARRLAPHYPVLYTGAHGFVAHECIVDLRPITRAAGVSVDDVAKRLMDYGFHAPTMSFPVAGTLMIEPTESESLRELDRFCEAMIAIRAEIDRDPSLLTNAPHTADDVTADRWDRSYTRGEAAYPPGVLRSAKYWPPVGRIDAAKGDRTLVCSCPPIEAFAEV